MIGIGQEEYLKNIGAVFLLLGPACNMTCRHCSQTPIKNTFSLKPSEELSQGVTDFLRRWLAAKGKKTNSRIYFWGGEPLLYWEKIKEYILRFEALGIKPRYFRIFSNGLLLNRDVAEFCNDHKVLFTLSYDAPDSLAVRNAVPGNEQIQWFLQIRRRSVNFVFSAPNDDPVRAFTVLEEKFPKTIVDMGLINVLSPIPEDIYDFPAGKIERAIDALADEIVAGKDPYGNRYYFFLEKFPSYNVFRPERFKEFPWPPCAPGLVSLSCKFNGDVVRCHNDNQNICHITDLYTDIMERHLRVWEELLPGKCHSCPAVSICRNRCPIALKTHDHSEYVHCGILRRVYTSVIRNFKKLTECEIKEFTNLRDWR